MSNLTRREIEVLRLLKSRLTYKEIAAALGISFNTVKKHLKSIYKKLSIGSKREAFYVEIG